MSTTRLKRIEELEAQLATAWHARDRARNEAYNLTTYLQDILRRGDALSQEEIQGLAREALALNSSEARLQQRDLNIAYLTIKRLRFPTQLRKQWSGGEIQHWIDQYAEVLRERAKAHQEDHPIQQRTLQ